MQNLQGLAWAAETVEDRLTSRMRRVFGEVWTIANERDISPRSAAYLLAVARVAEAARARGSIN